MAWKYRPNMVLIQKLKSVLFIPALVGVGVALASTACTSQTPPVPKGMQLAEKNGCVECHGSFGISTNPQYPNLAGQKKEYLINQLRIFRRADADEPIFSQLAHRYFGMMNAKAKNLDDAAIEDLAQYFSSRSCALDRQTEIPAPPPKVQVCEACHGKSGVSVQADIPNLAGQKPAYLEAQLRAFRRPQVSGQEGPDVPARYHWIMTPQAVKLDDRDIRSLSRYYSRLDCRPVNG